ncbi:MAG: class I SAM-dependent methyltransferase [Candidatus Nitrosotenuis sp.]
MGKISLVDLFLWTVRRNEKDVINMYGSLSNIMKIATGGDMLNFGYWDSETTSPFLAQKNMCALFAQVAQLGPGQKVVDVGCGFATPASLWKKTYSPIEMTCIDINFGHLRQAHAEQNAQHNEKIRIVNSTARLLPLKDESVDRVLALESAQHFKPFADFASESYRVLKKDGILAIAIPVVERPTSIMALGVLAMTWSSEHYAIDFIKSVLKQHGFEISSLQRIGASVYEPLAEYYEKNRESLKVRISKEYPFYVESILYNSLLKMKEVSKNKIIDYLLVVCKK